MKKCHKLSGKQFADAVRHLFLNKPGVGSSPIAENGELDQLRADNHIRHTTIGDPVIDPVMEELSSLPS